MKTRKFRKGKPYTNVVQVAKDVADGKWIYWHGKPQHPGWIQSMTLRTIMLAVSGKILSRTIRNA